MPAHHGAVCWVQMSIWSLTSAVFELETRTGNNYLVQNCHTDATCVLEQSWFDSARKWEFQLGAGKLDVSSAQHDTRVMHTCAGLLKVVFSTETLAAGINMPARTTVISALSRRNDSGHVRLTHNQLLQMAGRAGRRGYDTAGTRAAFLQSRLSTDVHDCTLWHNASCELLHCRLLTRSSCTQDAPYGRKSLLSS